MWKARNRSLIGSILQENLIEMILREKWMTSRHALAVPSNGELTIQCMRGLKIGRLLGVL